jgi:hypothetical protein
MEEKMTTVKSLAIIALLAGGTSLAMAQNGPATGAEPPGSAEGSATATGKNLRPFHHPFLHRRVYMQVPNGHKHKQSKMNPATGTNP